MDASNTTARQAGRTPARLPFHRQLGRFFALTLRQSHEDAIYLTASALAFVTILSLVPLLAALSFVGTRVFSQYPEKSLEVFIQVLPYSEKTLTDKLREFLDQAETMHGVGLAALFGTTLLAFATIEETFNKIWNVSRRRPFRYRLLTFFLLLFWGPLLIGVTFSSLILLRQTPAMRELVQGSLLLHLIPFLATVVGLTLLYWLVPSTNVRFRNALAGALFGAILLEILRQSFGYYVEFFRGVSTVYGSSAFVLLFMISIEITWTIVLLGSEAAYTAQHFQLLSRGLHTHPPVAASWVGLAALAFLARFGGEGESPPSSEELANHLSLPARDLERALHPLLARHLLRETPGRGYALGRDPAALRIEEVFDAYEHRARRSVEHIGADLRDRLERWVDLLACTRAERLGPLTLAELLAAPEGARTAGSLEPGREAAAGNDTATAGAASTACEPALTGTTEKR
jgi:membrane protein